MKLHTAKRNQVKLRLGLSGASGFGKTYSALLLAFGITNNWSKIAIIDTENSSSNLYAHLGNFNVLSLNDTYSPEKYIGAIRACENASMEVIIIDSITQEWNGKEGCLQIHEKLGGRFQDWGLVTRRHQDFMDAILNCSCHIITTVRSKVGYSMDMGSNGKTRVVKHGLKPITREGLDYEMTLFFELINDKHLAKASKDRTNLFSSKPEFIINAATGKKLIQWCNEGTSFEVAMKEIKECTTVDGLKHLFNKYRSLQDQIHPQILIKKEEIHGLSKQIIPKENVTKSNNSSS